MSVPARWNSGAQWGSAATDQLEAFWGPTAAPATRPVVYVSINGILQPTVTAASWKTGRDGWFSDLTPCSASFSFSEPASGVAGDQVIVTTETALLWVGYLENITTSKRLGDGGYTSTVTAVDGLARHGLAKMSQSLTFDGYTLLTIVQFISAQLGLDPIVVTAGDSATAFPSLNATISTRGHTLLEYIQLAEQTSNALMTWQPDGTMLAVVRDAIAAASVDVLDLVGIDTPRAWTVETLKSSVINHWVLTDSGGTDRLDASYADSILTYGESTYSVSDYMSTSATHFPSDMRTAMSEPRPVVSNGEFPIFDQDQNVISLAPLDWVSFDGDTWQVMSVEHSVTPNDWTMTITADVSQNYMGGTTDPTPDDPTGVTTDTQTLTSTKSATVVKTSGGSYMGNGAGNYLPVGYYSGFRHRALIDFTGWNWPAGFVRVKKATLNLRTTGQVWVAFGSKPKFYAKRITESWSEGTYDAAPTSQYSTTNAVVWPGPSKTSSGQTLKSIGTSENNDISVDVTDIMQDAHDAGTFHGIMLVASNEDSNVSCTEVYSDDHGTSGFRPELVLTCEVS